MKKFILILFLCPILTIGQDSKPYTASYIMEWGDKDTIAIETFMLYENNLSGKVIHGFPENHVRHFNITYDPSGSISDLIYLYNDIANTSLPIDSKTRLLPLKFSAKLHHDLLDFKLLQMPKSEDNQGENTSETRILLRTEGYHFNGDWIPISSQFEWLVKWFLKQNKQKIEGLKFINAHIGVHELQLERINKNHIRFWSNISEAIDIYLGDDDRIEMIDAMGSAWNLIIRRTAPMDIENYTGNYKNRPTIGVPSPHETVTETIGETVISIDYGRPSMRGRKIFGNVVPYGEVWRTGAGAATTITFDSDVYVKSQKVKAGTYNVYSLPARDAFILILNSKLDAWGSVYLPEFDVARLPMKLERSVDAIDKFTIAIQIAGNTGTLVLSWEKVVAKLKFEVRM